jgi:DNA-binding MarR family transcriptional regulator
MATTKATTGLGSELRGLLRAIRVVKRHHPPNLAAVPSGMTGILAAIGEDGGHVKDLAARCALDPSTVSRAVSALVKHGLVKRMADPADGRASVLGPTEAGRAALRDTEDWYDELLAAALSGWTREELDAFASMLRRFTEDVLRHLDGPVPRAPGGPQTPLPRRPDENNLETAHERDHDR